MRQVTSGCESPGEGVEASTEGSQSVLEIGHKDGRLSQRIGVREAEIRDLKEEVVKVERSKQEAAPTGDD